MPEWKEEIARQLRSLELAPAREAEIVEEVAQHLEDRYQELVAGGTTEEEARRVALEELSDENLLARGLRRVEQEVNSAPIVPGGGGRNNFLASIWQDIRYGLRMLRKSPGFTVIAVITLALGIGANTAIFSLIDVVVLRMLPVESPKQLVLAQCPDAHGGYNAFSYPTYEYLRDRNSVFSGIFALAMLERLAVTIDARPELASGQIVSGSYYSTLGVNAILGRTINPDDDKIPGKDPVAVISYAYWKRRFQLDRGVVGKAITVDRIPFIIIGVTPPEFFGLITGFMPDITVPMMQAQVMPGQSLRADLVGGRLKPGMSETQARANLDLLFQQTLAPPEKRELKIELIPGDRGLSFLRDRLSQPLFILMAVVGLVLLIACANVANLQLARATVRRKEIAVRIALGAGRPRLIRQLLIEGVLLAAAGGALGLVIALWGSQLLLALVASGPFPIFIYLPFDARVFGFTGAVSLLTAVLFGLAPGFRATRFDLASQLKASSEAARARRYRLGVGKALVISQVALSFLLLVGAALFVRTLLNVKNLYPGFNPDNILVFSMEPTLMGYKGTRLKNLYKEVLERIESNPSVGAASASRFGEFTPGRADWSISLPGYIPRNDEDASVQVNLVGPKFFETMGMPLLLGRDFTSQDGDNAPRVAVINETMARHYFGSTNPVGKRFTLSGINGQVEIAGVVRDAKYHSLREPTPRMAFLPFLQVLPSSLQRMTLEVRTTGNPNSMTATIREAVRSIDKNLPIFDVKTATKQMDESLFLERLVATLPTLFGLLALVLASVGLYGLMSYAVARRTNEIGIRMALGAQRSDVVGLVVGHGFRLTLVGVAIGIAGALALTRFLASVLYGVKPTDPFTFIAVSLLLTAVALAASYIPARRATKVDPMVALRYQ